MGPSLAKACALIMAFCGFRPEEIRRTRKWMVTLDGDRPQVIRNTAKGGHARLHADCGRPKIGPGDEEGVWR